MKILVIDDEKELLEVLGSSLIHDSHEVWTARTGKEAFGILEKGECEVVLLDLKLEKENGVKLLMEIHSRWPSIIVLMMTAFGRIEQAVEAMKAGAFDFLEKPFSLSYLRMRIEKVRTHLELQSINGMLREELGWTKGDLVGSHPAIRKVREQIVRFSRVEMPVLITGESGTGKEVAARMITCQSSRREKPFVAVNCGAIPEALMESILFGHEKGAFTGAHTRQRGKFELADGGTIFLDEIGELPITLQVKLLRVIESGEVERIGGERSMRVNVRILSATNRDLNQMMLDGIFRSDLFYRLNVLSLELPPLRERIEDMNELVDYLLKNLSRDFHRRLEKDPVLVSVLKEGHWPGNIRELKNVLERMAVLSEDGILRGKDARQIYQGRGRSEGGREVLSEGKVDWDFHQEIEKNEMELIRVALEKSGGNHTRAAKFLGMKRTTLQYRLKKMKLLDPLMNKETLS